MPQNKRIKQGDLEIAIDWQEDLDPDLSYLDRSEEDHYKDLADCKTKSGKVMSDRYRRILARRYVREDKERLDSYGSLWEMLGCTVTASYKGIAIDHESLWGIESDSAPSYFEEVERELLGEIDLLKALARITYEKDKELRSLREVKADTDLIALLDSAEYVTERGNIEYYEAENEDN